VSSADPVDLSHARIGGPIHVYGGRYSGGLLLTSSTIGGDLTIAGEFDLGPGDGGVALEADGLTVVGNVVLGGPKALVRGSLRLVTARIGGHLVLDGGLQVEAGLDGHSIVADGAQIGGGVYIDRPLTELDGAVRLVGATVGDQLAIADGARVAARSDGVSLDADGINVRGSVRLVGSDTILHGNVRLVGATIGQQVVVGNGVHIGRSDAGIGLDAPRLRADGVLITGAGTAVHGGVRLPECRVRGALAIHDVVISADAAPALDLDDAEVGTLRLLPTRLVGDVNLRSAQVGLLDDCNAAWADSNGVPNGTHELDGLRVRSVSPTAAMSVTERLNWLDSTGALRDRAASRATYRSVAGAYARSGDDDAAASVRRAARRAHDPALVRWILAPIQQGDAPQRALVALFVIVMITVGVVGVADSQGWIERTDGTNTNVPVVRYALESAVPFVNLRATAQWRLVSGGIIPNSGADLASIWLTIAPVFSLFALALFVAGVARMVIEERRQ
jgi:hypothetical protein